MKNLIITCANNKIGDFIINDWLKSLKKNVNLRNIDVVVIDYGLSEKHKKLLSKQKVILFEGTKKYHIVNKRFFDSARYLKTKKYDQVLFIDGGDVIFQDDISELFEKNKDAFRIVPIGVQVLFFEWFITLFGNFEGKLKNSIWRVVKNKPVINAGVIFAPVKKLLEMSDVMQKLIKSKESFGPDQIIVNYYIYKNGHYKFLDSKYNFMMSTEKNGFVVKKGVFYKKNGEKVAIVHNAGQMDFFRPIDDFGYGESKNKIKHLLYHAKRTTYEIIKTYKQIFSD